MKELFDKRFVYFMWDDKLEGKKGFFADDVDDLINAVEEDYSLGCLKGYGSDTYPFASADNAHSWRFFYYDPNYEYKVAYSEGKQIQVLWDDEDDWRDVTEEPLWSDDDIYRIKPTEEYRPYKDTEEMIKDFTERFEIFGSDISLPLIWVKRKGSSHRQLIISFHEITVDLSICREEMQELFENYTYLDGSPIGMKQGR